MNELLVMLCTRSPLRRCLVPLLRNAVAALPSMEEEEVLAWLSAVEPMREALNDPDYGLRSSNRSVLALHYLTLLQADGGRRLARLEEMWRERWDKSLALIAAATVAPLPAVPVPTEKPE